MVKLTYRDAEKYRKVIETAAESLTDEQALKAPMLFEHWEVGKHYTIGKRLYYDSVLYSVLIEHDSQSDWTPDTAVSLYARVLIPDPEVIPEWVQPESTNPYMIGDKVRHNDKVWISTVDNNVWEPGVYGWDEVVE